MVSFGSFQEMWSNTVPLSVALSAGASSGGVLTGVGSGVGAGGWPLSPNRGSHRGGTNVTFFLPSSWVFLHPLVSFGNAGTTPTTPTPTPTPTSAATPTTPSTDTQSPPDAYVAYTVTTPTGTLGQVAVTIHDANYPDAPVFPLGYFRYAPAAFFSTP